MNRSEHILEQLRAELGFSSQLIGGDKTVIAHIDRFLATHKISHDTDLHDHAELWDRLVAEVIIPETSFFRYPESFAALGQWIAERSPHRIRCLCLPCSTGEEAWSIAMTFGEAHCPVSIDAADVSARAIAHAKCARYSLRSVRGLPPAQRERWCEVSDRELAIAPELHPLVHFRAANVFSFHAEPQSYDVIFCRNLLIYFDAENQHRIFERLAGWLRPEGVLFLGPGEATVAASHGWQGTGRPMSFSFGRSLKRGVGLPPKKRSLPRKLEPPPSPPSSFSPRPRAPKGASDEEPKVNWLACAEELANAGKLADAKNALEKFHAAHPPSLASLLLRGIVEEARGQRQSAEADYRKALYLEPENIDALLHLSLLLENDGRARIAAPFRRRLSRLTLTP